MTVFSIAYYFLSNLERWYHSDMERLAEQQWGEIVTNLEWANLVALKDGEYLRLEIEHDINGLESVNIANALDNYLDANNPIRTIITEHISDYYFMGIVSDSTDPFVTLGDMIVFDDSADCSTVGSYRTFEQEFPMHANPELAENTFYKISHGTNQGELKYFQFIDYPEGQKIKGDYSSEYWEHADKKAFVLDTYNMKGMKDHFIKNPDWKSLFGPFEFIATTYIYEKMDLAGRKYIEDGTRTGYSRLAINIGFRFIQIINNNPKLKTELERIDYEKERAYVYMVTTQRTLIIVGYLFLMVSVVSMAYTIKILESQGKDEGSD